MIPRIPVPIPLASLPALLLVISCTDNAQKGFDEQVSALNEMASIMERAGKGDTHPSLGSQFKVAVNHYKHGQQLEDHAKAGERARLEHDDQRLRQLHDAQQRLATAIDQLTDAQKEKFALLLQEIGF